MKHRERILRNLEYLSGAMAALKSMVGTDGASARWNNLLNEWDEIIYDTIGFIEEDYEYAKNTRGTC